MSDTSGMKRTVAANPTDKVIFGQTNSVTFSNSGTVMSLTYLSFIFIWEHSSYAQS